MEILLVGGAGSFMEALVGKIKKEGHRIYVLTGAEHPVAEYPHVFEKYNFAYDNDCIKEICESVNPDVVVFMGAYDTNFSFCPKKKDEFGLSGVTVSGYSGAGSCDGGR